MSAAMTIRPAPHLAAIAAYPLAALATPKGQRLVSLAQNESSCPPSPAAMAAARKSLAEAALYPDPDCTRLRHAVADVHFLDPQRIVCAAGSMEIIAALARAYLAPGLRALTSAYGYLYFRTAALLVGAAVDLAPEVDLRVDIDELLAHVTPATCMVFLANPGNPTGTRIGLAAIVALREALPPQALLVIDEAYGEFAPLERTFDLPDRGDVVVLRSFSKAYGLAGLRVGWGVFPPAIATEVRKALPPNNVSAPAQAAAGAAVADGGWMRQTVATTVSRRDRFIERMRQAGVAVPGSCTNFALLDFGSAAVAARLDDALRARGIALRPMGSYGLNHCLRATVGADADMARAAEIIEAFMVGEIA
jgi:histidinol-phosphate aminotransferase